MMESFDKFKEFQLQEIDRCLNGYHDAENGHYVSGPIYFAQKYIRISHPINGNINFEIRSYQEWMIDSYLDNKNVITSGCRQSGKTLISSIFLLWYSIFHSNQTILVGSIKFEYSIEILEKIRQMYNRLPFWLKPSLNENNKRSMIFANDSRILASPISERMGRGMTISLLYLDEFAFVSPRIQEEVWCTLHPTLHTGGRCIITSTPNGSDDVFSKIWFESQYLLDDSSASFYGVNINWTQVKGMDKQFKNEMISWIGYDKWQQEFECKFRI